MEAANTISEKEYVLKSGDVCAHHARLFGDPATGQVTVTPADGLVSLGKAELDSSFSGSLTGDGTTTVMCSFGRTIAVTYVAPASVSPVNKCFQTVYPDASVKATSDNTLDTPMGIALEVSLASSLGILVGTNF